MRRNKGLQIGLEDVLKAGMYNYTMKDLKRLDAQKRRENKKAKKHVVVKRVLGALGVSYVLMFNLGDVVYADQSTNQSSQVISQDSQANTDKTSMQSDSSESTSQSQSDVSHETQNQNNQSVTHETKTQEQSAYDKKDLKPEKPNTKLGATVHDFMNHEITLTINFTYKGKYLATFNKISFNPHKDALEHPIQVPDDRFLILRYVVPPKGYLFADGSNHEIFTVDLTKADIIYFNIPVIKEGEKPIKQEAKQDNKNVTHETQSNKDKKPSVTHETKKPVKKENKGGLIPQTGEAKTNMQVVGVGLIGIVLILLGVLGIKNRKRNK